MPPLKTLIFNSSQSTVDYQSEIGFSKLKNVGFRINYSSGSAFLGENASSAHTADSANIAEPLMQFDVFITNYF